jgi:hypothetical protein
MSIVFERRARSGVATTTLRAARRFAVAAILLGGPLMVTGSMALADDLQQTKIDFEQPSLPEEPNGRVQLSNQFGDKNVLFSGACLITLPRGKELPVNAHSGTHAVIPCASEQQSAMLVQSRAVRLQFEIPVSAVELWVQAGWEAGRERKVTLTPVQDNGGSFKPRPPLVIPPGSTAYYPLSFETKGNHIQSVTVTSDLATPPFVIDDVTIRRVVPSPPPSLEAVLSLSGSLSSGAPFHAGDRVEFVVNISNVGNAKSSDAHLDATFINLGDLQVDGACQALDCKIPDIAPNDAITVTLSATIEREGKFGATVTASDPSQKKSVSMNGSAAASGRAWLFVLLIAAVVGGVIVLIIRWLRPPDPPDRGEHDIRDRERLTTRMVSDGLAAMRASVQPADVPHITVRYVLVRDARPGSGSTTIAISNRGGQDGS